MLIEVTQEDIVNGECLPNKCPIALALKRILPNHIKPYIYINEIRLYQADNSSPACPPKTIVVQTPIEARYFVIDYDSLNNDKERQHALKPFTFNLLLPDNL